MHDNQLRHRYFDWLSSFSGLPNTYTLMLWKLFDTPFEWLVPFDAYRADDGVELRYRFGRECNIPDPVICGELDNVPCSILEVIVALALRCEEQIMGDESIGNRTPMWMQSMLDSLGLLAYPDNHFDPFAVDEIIYIFLNRQYAPTGQGGLFTIPDLEPDRDMRTAEIWAQACWYMNRHN